MSDNEADDNTLTKPKKQRSEKQIAATQRMREALQKRQDEFAAKKQPEPPKVNKKEVLKILKEKLNAAKEPSEETDVESEEEPEPQPVKPVAKEKKAVPAPVVVAKEKPKKIPKYVEPDSESEEEIIVVKKKKKPKKKTIIVEESSSEEEEPIPIQREKKKKQVPPPVESDDEEQLPTRHTRSQQNKIAKIGVATSVKKPQTTHFFMD
jgi:hypothetical protein